MVDGKKIQEMINQLNTNIDVYEVPEYEITEISSKNLRQVYIVNNLEAELEDGEIYFKDIEDKIYENEYTIMGFLVESIKEILLEKEIILILFETHSIKIELIK